MISYNMLSFFLFTGVYVLLTWAFYLPMRAGLIFNGPVYIAAVTAFFAAYAKQQWGWPFGLILLAGIGIGTLVGFVPAKLLARTKGFAMALATMAIIFIVQTGIRNMPFLGGRRGFLSIPEVSGLLPITWIIVLVIGVVIYRIERSRIGRATEVMRTNPDIAGAIGGVYPVMLSVIVQTISGAISGAIFPQSFGLSLLILIWTILFVGGQTTMWGTLAFTPILWGFVQIIPQALTEYTEFILGGILVAVLISRPKGALDRKVISTIAKLFTKRGKRTTLQ